MPGLDLCAAGLCRPGRALLLEERDQTAAAQGGVFLGRGAVMSQVTKSIHVVPALMRNCASGAGTHSHRNQCYDALEQQPGRSHTLWLWVPAFAGTTSYWASTGSTLISGHSFFHRAAFLS